MGELLANTLPLALGAAVSPIVLAITIAMLTGTGRVPRALAFMIGEAVILVGLAAVLLLTGAKLSLSGSPGLFSKLDLVFAALLLCIGFRALHRERVARGAPPETARAEIHEKHAGVAPSRAFAIGAGSMATNVTSLILYLPAVKDIAASILPFDERVAVAALVILVVLSTVWLPLVVSLLAPETAERVLDRVADFFHTNQRRVTIVLCLGFGAYLLVRGLAGL